MIGSPSQYHNLGSGFIPSSWLDHLYHPRAREAFPGHNDGYRSDFRGQYFYMESCSQNIQRAGEDIHNYWGVTRILQTDRIHFSTISSCDPAFYTTHWRRHGLFRYSVLNVIPRSSPAPAMVVVKLQKCLGGNSCFSDRKIHTNRSPPLYYFDSGSGSPSNRLRRLHRHCEMDEVRTIV